MRVVVTNVNYRGSLNETINLHEMKLCFPTAVARLCFHPFQLIIKDEKCTLLFFTSGNYRVMGFKTDDEWEASLVVYKYTKSINKNHVPILTLQSMTVKSKFDKPVDLNKLSTLIKSQLELQLLPVLTITHFKPITVNVFSTGSIIICGVKDIEKPNTILNEIENLLNVCSFDHT